MRRGNNAKKRRPRKKKNTGYILRKQGAYSNFESPRIGFLDPHKYVRLKYSDIFSFSLATITGTNQLMNLNSLFDPDRTGVGHQPYGYDQLSALYNRYRVLKTSWKITFHAEATGFYIVVVPTNGTLATAITNQASYSTACEVPPAVVKAQGTGANSVIVRGSIALNDLNGCTKVEYLADDRFESQVGASPTELMILNIGNYNPAGTSVNIDYTVEMEFFVDFHDPIILASS